MSKLNLPLLSNSISDPSTLVNQYVTALSGALFFTNPTLITSLPATPIVGNIYLIAAGATSPLTPGDVLLYLAATATGYTTFTPLDGAVAGNYIRSTSSSISTWTATASGGGGGTGDMLKSVYDINLNGVVDDSEKLGGQLPSYYLSRGLSPWSAKTASYTALMGDRLRYSLTVDTTITLPLSPNLTDSEVWIQRIETTVNKLIIDPNGNLIDGQSGKYGLFNPADFRAVERLSWAGGTIGYLSQEGRLTYQNSVVVPNYLTKLRFETFPFVDDIATNTLTNISVTLAPTPISGTGSGLFPIGSRLNILMPSTPIGAGDFTVQCQVKFNSLVADSYLWDWKSTGGALTGNNYFVGRSGGKWIAYFGGAFYFNYISAIDTVTIYTVAVCRSGTTDRLYINGINVASIAKSTTLLTNSVTIGNYFDGTYDRSPDAVIDNFFVTNNALYG